MLRAFTIALYVVLLVAGSLIIYAFGAGYFASVKVAGVPLHVPSPLHIVVTPTLILLLSYLVVERVRRIR